MTRIFTFLRNIENCAVVLALILLSLFPFLEVLARKLFLSGIPGSSEYIFHLVFWITFLGGMVTTREGKHLSLSIGIDSLNPSYRDAFRIYLSFLSATICFVLFWGALSFVAIGFDPTRQVGVIPIRIATAIMPVGYGIMAIRFLLIPPLPPARRWIAYLACVIGILFSLPSILNLIDYFGLTLPIFDRLIASYDWIIRLLFWPLLFVLIASILLGAPIFIVIGGITFMLFSTQGGAMEVISNEAYTLLTGPSFPAIPLFTFAGFILSESRTGERLLNLFKALLGWMPGGVAVMTVFVCAFFTTFTGASGVTILSLGSLLSFALVAIGFKEGYAQGLVTASGSIGLLFPPSLPIILYGIIAHVNIKHVFIGGLLPGLLMVLTLSMIGIFISTRTKHEIVPFHIRSVASAGRMAIWELLLPVLILYGFFSGLTTLNETGAVAVLYAIVIECFIHKDIPIKRLSEVAQNCIAILGGIMIILAVARALSFYIIDAEIPFLLKTWIKTHIHSKYLFLALLNLGLIITGCLMDIFSAIVVVVPLILPLSELFDIHPVHLGIIFLANMELGYLTPPVGLNLFMASYRFNQPLIRVYRNMFPFFVALLITLLLITYIPFLSTMLL